MKKIITAFSAIFMLFGFYANAQHQSLLDLAPQPRQAYQRAIYSGIFVLTPETKIYLFEHDPAQIQAEYLNEFLRSLQADTLEFEYIDSYEDVGNGIFLTKPNYHVNKLFDEMPDQKIQVSTDYPGAEGYILDVMPAGVIIAGSDYQGVFHGINTFLQLLKNSQNNNMVFPCRVVDAPRWPNRWQVAGADISEDEEMQQLKTLIANASFYKMNGIVFDESSLGKIPLMSEDYRKKLGEIADFAKLRGVDMIPASTPWNNTSAALARNVNFAAGLPVYGQRFVIDDSVARVVPIINVTPENGSFEKYHEIPGGYEIEGFDAVSAVIDSEHSASGEVSLRFDNTSGGTMGFEYSTEVAQHKQYRLSFKYRTKTNNPNGMHCMVYISSTDYASELDYRKLIHFQTVGLEHTNEWRQANILFNPLEKEQAFVKIFVTPENDTAWIDDFNIEETAFVNILRREGAEFHVSHQILDILYTEGDDYARLEDPMLGMAGGTPGNYDNYHTPPEFRVLPESSIREGDTLIMSYFHAFPYPEDRVSMTMGTDTVYDIMRDITEDISSVFGPDAHYMNHHIPSAMNYDAGERALDMTPYEIFEYNVDKSMGIISDINPDAAVWDNSYMYVDRPQMRDYYLMYVDGEMGKPDDLEEKPGLLNYNAINHDYFYVFDDLGERGYEQLLTEAVMTQGIDCFFGNGDYCSNIDKLLGFFRRPDTGPMLVFADFAWNHPPYIYHYPMGTQMPGLDTLALMVNVYGHNRLTDFKVGSVSVLYRFKKNNRFTAMPVQLDENGFTTARIPLPPDADGIQYYFMAESNRRWSTRLPLGANHYFELGDLVSSVDDREFHGDLSIEKIFPLPAGESNSINIRWTSAGQGTATIYIVDILGRTVFETDVQATAGINTTNIDAPNFEKGVYLVSIRQNGKMATRKIIW
jgi:hypothetical protein